MIILRRSTWLVIGAFLAFGLVTSLSHPVLAQGQSGTTLTTTVTAEGSWSGGAQWRIEKSVTPDAWTLFHGDTGTSQYKVIVTKEGGSGSGPGVVGGEICVANQGERATENLAITAVVQYKVGSGQFQDLASAPVDVSAQPVLGAGETVCYAYEVGFTPVDGAVYRVVSLVTITNHAGHVGEVFGPQTKADFSLLGSATPGSSTITVVDSNGQSWTFDDSGSVTYDQFFTCTSAGSYTVDNVATIQETGQSATAQVQVNCYDLMIDKTVATSTDGDYAWSIDKIATPDYWDLLHGDSGTSQYTISVVKEGYATTWAVEGTITVYNPSPLDATVVDLFDTMPPGIEVGVDCPVGFPYILAGGQSLTCDYATDLPDGAARTNVGTVTLQNWAYDYMTGAVSAGTTDFSAQAAVDFGSSGNGAITVEDSNGQSWTFTDSGSVTYEQTYVCDEPGWHSYDNMATILETGQSADTTVSVQCFDLDVRKEVNPTLTIAYNWTIDKSADQTSVTLQPGQATTVNYTVAVNASASSLGTVEGLITVFNPTPFEVTLDGISDIISEDIPLEVECPVDFPYVLNPRETVECSYAGILPDASHRINTAIVTIENHAYDYLGNGESSGTTNVTAQVDVDFGGAPVRNEVGTCADVSDSLAGFLGTACVWDLTVPAVFTYSADVGPYSTCGDYVVDNTASYMIHYTAVTGSSSWEVAVQVPCSSGGSGGCTRTIGYWKTHAGIGPQADVVTELLPIWLGTPGGAYSIQVTDAAQAVDILGMSLGDPSNGITKLYAQLLAAKLNIASGADAAVTDAISAADAFLSQYSWEDWANLSSEDQQMALDWMTAFDQFNNGLAGPAHCDDSAALEPEITGGAMTLQGEGTAAEATCVLPVDRQPVAACIAERYGVSYDTVLHLHFCEHQGFGNIERAYAQDKSQLPCMAQGNGTGNQGQGGHTDNPGQGQGHNNPPGPGKPNKGGGKK